MVFGGKVIINQNSDTPGPLCRHTSWILSNSMYILGGKINLTSLSKFYLLSLKLLYFKNS